MSAMNDLAQMLGAPPARLANVVPLPVESLDRAPAGAVTRMGGRWFVAGDPPLVVVEISPDAMAVAVPRVVWDVQVPTLTLGETRTRSRHSGEPVVDWFLEAVEHAVVTRRASFAICGECNQANPPEWMHDADICQSCAEAHHGIVY